LSFYHSFCIRLFVELSATPLCYHRVNGEICHFMVRNYKKFSTKFGNEQKKRAGIATDSEQIYVVI